MSFIAQVRLSDVPTLPGDQDLLSFHYCLACTEAGHMSFGSNDDGNRGFALTLHPYEEVTALDGLGVVAPGCLPSMSAEFLDTDEVPGLEDAWALDLKPSPALFSGGDDDFSMKTLDSGSSTSRARRLEAGPTGCRRPNGRVAATAAR